MRRAALLSAVGIPVLALAAACASGKPIDYDTGGDDDDSVVLQTNLTSFVASTGYFTVSCLTTSCHEGPAPVGGVSLGRVGQNGVTKTTIYNSLRTRPNVVNTANVAASTLLTKPIDPGVSHVGSKPWSDGGREEQGVTTWIQRGAQND